MVSGDRTSEGKGWAADRRDRVADDRDEIADQRDLTADARDAVASARDVIADAREAQLDAWEAALQARASTLTPEVLPGPDGGEPSAARAARLQARQDRDLLGQDRDAAKDAREEAAGRRSDQARATLLAAAFAGIAEHLYEAETPEQVLERVADAAVATIAGSHSATVRLDTGGELPHAGNGQAPDTEANDGVGAHLSYPVRVEPGDAPQTGASLDIFPVPGGTFDDTAREIGFILAAHASLAVRAVGERVTLEAVNGQLEHALESRDVIGQAKGILMERLGLTADEAFEVLREASQRLNLKLRRVAHHLAETGDLGPADPPAP